ncbi:MAG: hypothetical protein HRF49_09305 [bacterium]|jgi:hypothetical protein
MAASGSKGRYATKNSHLYGRGFNLKRKTAVEFWQYGFSDLMANINRGVFAKWMVASILGVKPSPRDVLREFDFVYEAKSRPVSVFVKASAVLQVWGPTRHFEFDGMKPDRLKKDGITYTGKRSFWSDLYVFAVQMHESEKGWDAFDLDQWRFWVLRAKDLAAAEKASGAGDMVTIALGRVRKLYTPLARRYNLPDPLEASDLKDAIEVLASRLRTG